MKHKDWTTRAAEEIADSVVEWRGKHVVECNVDAIVIRDIIVKHHTRAVRPEPGHIQDWAAKCGAYLHAEGVRLSSHRIAAVVAHFAEPLVKLLREARRDHYHQQNVNEYERRWCCHMCSCGEASLIGECTCGADAWNARIDEALNG